MRLRGRYDLFTSGVFMFSLLSSRVAANDDDDLGLLSQVVLQGPVPPEVRVQRPIVFPHLPVRLEPSHVVPNAYLKVLVFREVEDLLADLHLSRPGPPPRCGHVEAAIDVELEKAVIRQLERLLGLDAILYLIRLRLVRRPQVCASVPLIRCLREELFLQSKFSLACPRLRIQPPLHREHDAVVANEPLLGDQAQRTPLVVVL
mmetsp:Transcript_23953/g.51382  ORF Transcript_23953/g.51382 Transcript_23953/m.51382 type:complete len:203 (+) Transcript_23953:398-1006(+)